MKQGMQTVGNKSHALDPTKIIIHGTLNRNLSTFIARLGPLPL